jgi:hypothetical protein
MSTEEQQKQWVSYISGHDFLGVAWLDQRNRSTTGIDIYAQRIGPGAAVSWGQNGVSVCNAPG